MKIIRLPGTRQAARVQAPLALMRHIAKDPLLFPSTHTDPRLQDGEALLTATHSKLYYQGGGWWYLTGYAADGEDINGLLTHLTKLSTPSALAALI